MKRQTLVNGLLSLTAVSFMIGCVDDKYDLTDIDTTSQFTVKDLTVPVNLSQIKLENVINLDGNENITTENGFYTISKHGDIADTEFSIDKVDVNVPSIDPTSIQLGLDGLPVPPGTHVTSEIEHSLGIPASEMVDYSFMMNTVPDALVGLKGIKTSPIKVNVVLSIKQELLGDNNSFSFHNLKLRLPQDLTGVSGVSAYDPATGEALVSQVEVDLEGKAIVEIFADGLDLGDKGKVNDHMLRISGNVGVIGGNISLKFKDITLPEKLTIDVSYKVEAFTVESFSGVIDYKMDDINIAPISLNDLPDFLDNPNTKLFIANPQITVDIHNPIGFYNTGKNDSEKLIGKGRISLTSIFKETSVERTSGIFELVGENESFAFCTPKEGYKEISFEGLHNILTALKDNENPKDYVGIGLPETIQVNINDIRFSGDVVDFPLGDLGNAYGKYDFNAPLGFGAFSKVVYESTEDGWGSDDLDKVNIKKLHLKALCSTNLPVSIELSVVPVDKHGNEIKVKENKGFIVPAYGQNTDVDLLIEGDIKDFDGVKFTATVEQNGEYTNALGPDLFIDLKDLRVTVDGYYETDF